MNCARKYLCSRIWKAVKVQIVQLGILLNYLVLASSKLILLTLQNRHHKSHNCITELNNYHRHCCHSSILSIDLHSGHKCGRSKNIQISNRQFWHPDNHGLIGQWTRINLENISSFPVLPKCLNWFLEKLFRYPDLLLMCELAQYM